METLTEKPAGGTPASAPAKNGSHPPPAQIIQDVPIGEILRSPFNREVDTKSPEFAELVDSIRQHGVIQPGVARPLPTAFDITLAKSPLAKELANAIPRYELVVGEHRWLGSAQAKRATMPLIVRQLTDLEVVELQTIENDKRKDLSPIEEAEKYQQLIGQYEKTGLTKEKAVAKLSEKLSKGKSTVFEALRLLKLPAEAKDMVKLGRMPPSHAGVLLKLEEFPESQKRVAQQIVKPGKNDEKEGDTLSFRATRNLVEQELDLATNRQKWARLAEADFKKGIKFLDDATAAKVMPSTNNYVDSYRSGYVESDDYCDEYGTDYGKLWGKFEPPKFLVHNVNYSAFTYVYKKVEALASIKANGKKPPQQNDGAARLAARANQAAAKARKEAAKRRAIVSAVVKRAAGGNGRWTLELFKFIVAAMRQRILSDTAREMFNRRGLKRDDYKTSDHTSAHYSWLDKEIAAIKNAPQAVGLIMDMALAMDLTAWSGQQGSGAKLVDQACRIFGVDKNALATQETHTKAAKVAKDKAAPTPDARKATKAKTKGQRLKAKGKKR